MKQIPATSKILPFGKALTLLLFLVCSLPVEARASVGKKAPPMTFRVHAETHQRDTEVFAIPLTMGDPPMNLVVEKMPLISEREVQAFYPFDAPNGTYGVYFQLDNHGTKAWEALTTTRRSGFLVVVYNGRPLTRLRLGRPVRDGIVMVPHGLTAEEIQVLEGRYPKIGSAAAPQAPGRSTPSHLPVPR